MHLKIRVLQLLAVTALTLFPIAAILLSGPGASMRYYTMPSSTRKALIAAKHVALKQIAPDASVAATFEFLAPLSARPQLRSMHHILSGRHTLSTKPYPIPQDLDVIIFDTTDRMTFYPDVFHGPTTYQRFQAVLQTGSWVPSAHQGSLIMLTRTNQPPRFPPFAATVTALPATINTNTTLTGRTDLTLAGFTTDPTSDPNWQNLHLYWKTGTNQTTDTTIQLTLNAETSNAPHEVIHPLGSRIWPAQSWPPDSIMRDTLCIPYAESVPLHDIAIRAARKIQTTRPRLRPKRR